METSKLEQELNEKLPPHCIRVSVEDCLVTYYDFHGVTFRESKKEQMIVEKYLLGVITDKVGSPVKIIGWGHSNNGHFAHYFERVLEKK